eukprot:1197764-Pyramimonas_sp.AAC.1
MGAGRGQVWRQRGRGRRRKKKRARRTRLRLVTKTATDEAGDESRMIMRRWGRCEKGGLVLHMPMWPRSFNQELEPPPDGRHAVPDVPGRHA